MQEPPMASASSGSTAGRASGRTSPAPSNASSSISITPISTPPPGSVPLDGKPDDSSKLRAILGILRKFIGVADIAAVRFSLPSQLLEPIPNLEYWHYLDRPETFVSIGKSDDELGRMLEVLRFWFTKDLKYVKGKPCKPYNSTLGEFFRCNWEITDEAPLISTKNPSKSPNLLAQDAKTTPSKSPNILPQDATKPPPSPAINPSEPVRVSYLTEQTSHHPPVSAFYVDCPARSLSARGYDQISAKFTGTAVRVTPGNHNLGIFITLHNRGDEEYQMTHPAASLGGLLRGALSISVADVCFITCPKTRMKTILHYLEEGWIGKAQNIVQGVVFRYDPDNDKITRIRDVPEKDILVRIEGCWKEQVYYWIENPATSKNNLNPESKNGKQLLVDLIPLMPLPKIVPPEEEQLPNESRRFWREVTSAINSKQFAEATKAKQAIEERQREKAAERKAQQIEWKPRFFTGAVEPKGKPDLSEEGKEVLEGMQSSDFHLNEADITAA